MTEMSREEVIKRIEQLIEDYRPMLQYHWTDTKPKMEALRLLVADAKLIVKYKQLCINAEACEHCCPCPHKEFCPQEPLYQEIKSKLGIATSPDTALAPKWIKPPKFKNETKDGYCADCGVIHNKEGGKGC